MRRQLLLSLTLFCLSLTVACKDNPVGPADTSGGLTQSTPDVQAQADANGTASVLLPTKPVTVTCYINYGDQWWHPVGTSFDGHLDTPWCALTRTDSQWRLFMFSSSNYAGSTAGFVVLY
jgi:hypothetical protein